MSVAAGVELSLVVLLVVAPGWGLLGTAALLCGYALDLRQLPPQSPCNCFGPRSRTVARTAVARNSSLALLAAVGSAVVFVGSTSELRWDVAAPAASVVLAAMLALEVLALVLPARGVEVVRDDR